MYKLLILAGNHPDQRRWSSEVFSSLSDLFSEILIHQYRHWDDPQVDFIDFELELEELRSSKLVKEQSVLFGKSAGVLLAFLANSLKYISPIGAVFVGTPLHWARENNFPIGNWINQNKIPTVYIQQEFDPACSAEDLKRTLPSPSRSPSRLVQLKGSSHDYEDFDQLKDVVTKFIDLIQ
jgi:pimeloyl-ACP methyl ester carboxylesterase